MTKNDSGYITDHPVLPHEQWVAARTALLAQEKDFTRLRDELTKRGRVLPWERVEKDHASTRRMGGSRWATCSSIAGSSSCTTSCSRRSGAKGANTVRSGPIASMASACT